MFLYLGQKAPTHNGKLRESNCMDGSHISQLLAHFKNFPFFRTPCTIFGFILGQKCHKTSSQEWPLISQNPKFQKDWMGCLELIAKTVI